MSAMSAMSEEYVYVRQWSVEKGGMVIYIFLKEAKGGYTTELC
jgi:hypothetical protein